MPTPPLTLPALLGTLGLQQLVGAPNGRQVCVRCAATVTPARFCTACGAPLTSLLPSAPR